MRYLNEPSLNEKKQNVISPCVVHVSEVEGPSTGGNVVLNCSGNHVSSVEDKIFTVAIDKPGRFYVGIKNATVAGGRYTVAQRTLSCLFQLCAVGMYLPIYIPPYHREITLSLSLSLSLSLFTRFALKCSDYIAGDDNQEDACGRLCLEAQI